MAKDTTIEDIRPKTLADVLQEELASQCGRDAKAEYSSSQDESERIAAVHQLIRNEAPQRSAICLSGGGIRSAAFCDGVLYALSRLNLLHQINYISTVGTGGLVGGWEAIKKKGAGPVADDPFPAAEINRSLNPKGEHAWDRGWAVVKNVLISSIVILSCLAAVIIGFRLLTAAVVANPSDERGVTSQVITAGIFIAAAVLVCLSGAVFVVGDRSSRSQHSLQQRFLLLNILPSLVSAAAIAIGWARICSSRTFHDEYPFKAYLALAAGILACAFLFGWIGGAFRVSPEHADTAHGFVAILRAMLRLILVVALACLLGSMLLVGLFPNPAADAFKYTCLVPPLLTVALVLVGNSIRRAFGSRLFHEEPTLSLPAWITLIIFAWLFIYGSSYLTSWLLFAKPSAVYSFLVCGLAAGILVARGGFSAATGDRSFGNTHIGKLLLSIGGALFFLALLSLINVVIDQEIFPLRSTGALWWTPMESLFYVDMILLSIPILVGICIGFFVDVNALSLQAIYRDSLRRFLRKKSATADLRIGSLAGQQPFLVINLAVDSGSFQTGDTGEQITSFTITPLHCGSAALGYRPSDQYGAGINLDTAVSVSGSVGSPNIGYHPSRLVAAVMTFATVRLCWWKGHPGSLGARTWRRLRPGHIMGPLLAELFSGRFPAWAGWVNLTNGGRFDNLGLYEMVARRCRFIIVVDAGPDLSLTNSDFANAIYRIAPDIPIDIELPALRNPDIPIRHIAVGVIRYSVADGPDAPDGLLIHVKPVISGDEPIAIQSYATAHPEYPHQSGRESSLTPAVLENYRMLGAHSIQTFASGKSDSIEEFFRKAMLYAERRGAPATERRIFASESRDADDRKIASKRAAQGLNKIFISYRREDTPDAAGRIYDRLLRDFSPEYVFKDVDSIPYGLDFPKYLSGVIEECAVCLVIIGRSWLTVTDQQGTRRLDNPNDFVRIEVESALKREIPVIPLLVQNTQMPKPFELPEPLRNLCRRNGTPIQGDPNFHSDMDRLVNRLKKDLSL